MLNMEPISLGVCCLSFVDNRIPVLAGPGGGG